MTRERKKLSQTIQNLKHDFDSGQIRRETATTSTATFLAVTKT